MSKPRLITVNGITDSIRGWEKRTGIPDATITNRLKTMSPKEVLGAALKKPRDNTKIIAGLLSRPWAVAK